MDEMTRNLLMILDSLNKNISEGKVLNYEFDSHLNAQQMQATENHKPTLENVSVDVVLKITYQRSRSGG